MQKQAQINCKINSLIQKYSGSGIANDENAPGQGTNQVTVAPIPLCSIWLGYWRARRNSFTARSHSCFSKASAA